MTRTTDIVSPVDILLVEDNIFDVQMVRWALSEVKAPHALHVARDGEDAMDFLRQRGDFREVPRPGFILLDLNLPRKGGLEVLAETKADPSLRRIPVIILTTSKTEDDIMRSYDLHGNCFITKPLDLVPFVVMVQAITDFWLSHVALPPSAA